MKKSIKKITIGIIVLISLLIIVSILIYLPLLKYDLNLNDIKQLAKMELEQKIGDNEFSDYYRDSQRNIDVEKYFIKININDKDEWIAGNTKIIGEILGDTLYNFNLNFYDNFKIDSVIFNGKKTEFKLTGKNIIIERSFIPKTKFEIEIFYFGKPKSEGFGSFEFGRYENSNVIYTINEPIFASTWFPCNDLPDDKAYYEIWIENDSSYTSLSNGKLVDTQIKDARKIYHWKTEYPMSTYLAAIYSAKYSRVIDSMKINDKDLKLEYYFLPGKREIGLKDFSIHNKILSFFSNKFGEYPFIDEKYGIAEIMWNLGAIENQTITGIGQKFVGGMGLFNDLLIHEAAHSWWGNAVTPKTWKDTWLSEGFATYSEALYWENLSGRSSLISTILPKKRDYNSSTLYNPSIEIFSNLVYNKGAWVLHMLRFELGDKTFFNCLRSFFEKYKYKNADTEDFKRLCERLSGKNLNHFFSQWVYDGIGLLEVDYRIKKNNDYKYELSLKQVQSGYDTYKYPLEIKIVTLKDSLINKYWITEKDTTLTLSAPEKIIKIQPDPNDWLMAHFNEILN